MTRPACLSVAPVETTSAIDRVALVAPAPTSRVSPVAEPSTVTFADGHAVVSLDLTVPDVIDVNRTGYGFGLAIVNDRSPSVKPG